MKNVLANRYQFGFSAEKQVFRKFVQSNKFSDNVENIRYRMYCSMNEREMYWDYADAKIMNI